MTYDPVSYWEDRGRTYEADFRRARYRDQERELRTVLSRLAFRSVLEVGCGFGRIARLISDVRPGVDYTGIDLSEDMLASAQRKVPAGRFMRSSLREFPATQRFDLIIAVEVLMHVPPREIAAAIWKLRALSDRHILTVDWTEPVSHPAPHNFIHDYSILGGETVRVGRQTIRLVTR